MWTLLAFLWSTGEASSLSLDLPDQLVVWLEGKDELLATCRREMEERVSNVDRVVLVEVDNCTRMDQPSGHIPHGRFDSEGRLEGKVSLLALTLTENLSGRTSDHLGQRFGQRGGKAKHGGVFFLSLKS